MVVDDIRLEQLGELELAVVVVVVVLVVVVLQLSQLLQFGGDRIGNILTSVNRFVTAPSTASR